MIEYYNDDEIKSIQDNILKDKIWVKQTYMAFEKDINIEKTFTNIFSEFKIIYMNCFLVGLSQYIEHDAFSPHGIYRTSSIINFFYIDVYGNIYSSLLTRKSNASLPLIFITKQFYWDNLEYDPNCDIQRRGFKNLLKFKPDEKYILSKYAIKNIKKYIEINNQQVVLNLQMIYKDEKKHYLLKEMIDSKIKLENEIFQKNEIINNLKEKLEKKNMIEEDNMSNTMNIKQQLYYFY